MHPIVQLCMAIDEHVEAQYPNQEKSCWLLPRFYQGSAQTASDALDGQTLASSRPADRRSRLRGVVSRPMLRGQGQTLSQRLLEVYAILVAVERKTS